MGRQSACIELIERAELRARSKAERTRILKTGERTGSRPKPPEAVARAAPALSPADHRSKSAQLLPGDRAFLSPSLAKIASRKLDAGVEASGPHDFAVRIGAVRQERQRGHRIPPRVRDDREPPLCVGRDAVDIKLIWVRRQAKFLKFRNIISGRIPVGASPNSHSPRASHGPTPTRAGALRPRRRRYAALILAMKRSSSSRSRALSLERVLAECSTSSEAEPVSVAPRLTCMMLAAASSVPRATF